MGRVREAQGSLGGSRRVLEDPGWFHSKWRVQEGSKWDYNVLGDLVGFGMVWEGPIGSRRVCEGQVGSRRVWEGTGESSRVREASFVCIGMGRSRWFKEDIGGLGREEAPPLL